MTIQELTGSHFPLIQAPMAGVQDSELAITVAKAGGIGSIACAMLSADAIEREVNRFRDQAPPSLNLNFTCSPVPKANPEVECEWFDLIRPYLEEFGLPVDPVLPASNRQSFGVECANLIHALKPEIVSFHFGLPEYELLQYVRSSGCNIISTATTLVEAQWLEKQGVSAIIAQGLEAGGHRGHFLSNDLSLQSNTLSLVETLVRHVSVPVIAAGGIHDAHSAKAAFAKGAAAIQVGTAYLRSHESKASHFHQSALSDPNSKTTITSALTGRPARGIINRLIRDFQHIDSRIPDYPIPAGIITQLRHAAENQYKNDFTLMWAGERFGTCEEASAAAITRRIMGVVS